VRVGLQLQNWSTTQINQRKHCD